MEEFGYKVKRGTLEDWQTYCSKYEEEYGETYIPDAGKLLAVGFEDDQTGEVFFKLKLGNGITAFLELPYVDNISDTGISVEKLAQELYGKQDELTAGEGIIIKTQTGKNLFSVNHIYVGCLTSDGIIDTSEDNYITSEYISVNRNTSYVLSCNYTTLDDITIALYDSDKQLLDYENGKGQIKDNNFQWYRFKPTANGYVRFTVRNSNTNIMLNEGTAYLPYEEYVKLGTIISSTGGGGTGNYVDLTNKPQINGHTLNGNKSSSDLDLQDKLTPGDNINIDENGVISASSGVSDYDEILHKPQINNVELIGNKSLNDLGIQAKIDVEIRKAIYELLNNATYVNSNNTTNLNIVKDWVGLYSVTNTLTHCTTSNNHTEKEKGSSYTATLTPDSNYELDTVTVTMGGTDITSTAYDDGVITISNVTGDIVITAIAIIDWTDGFIIPQSSLVAGKISENPPYYTSATNRVSYVGTDILVDYGYQYTVTATFADGVSPSRIGVQQLNSDVYNKVLNNESFPGGSSGGKQDSGWQSNGYTAIILETYKDYPISCLWLTFETSAVSNIEYITITKEAVV